MIGRTGSLVSILALALAGRSADVAVEALPEGAPAGIAEPVRAVLAPSGFRILASGKPFLEFWFRSVLLAREASAEKGVRYGLLQPGALVGVVRVGEGAVDFRAQKLAPGLYTIRYGIQPDDGDHQEQTEARDFLLLSAANDDLRPETMEPKPLVKQSARLNGKKHPAVLFLAAGQEGPTPRIRTQGDPPQTVFEAELPGSGGKPIRLTIVVVGKYKD